MGTGCWALAASARLGAGPETPTLVDPHDTVLDANRDPHFGAAPEILDDDTVAYVEFGEPTPPNEAAAPRHGRQTRPPVDNREAT
jgi:hypothetical protein